MDAYFGSTASYWEEIYTRTDLYARIYRRRQSFVLSMVDSLALPPHSRALEIGCGPGLTTVALARHGLVVDAIDTVDAMVRGTRKRAVEYGLAERVRAGLGDARRLEFADETFRVVLAIGVTEWLGSVEEPLREMARVLEPGGYLLVNADNRWALHHLLDPCLNPAFEPLKERIARLRTRSRGSPPPPRSRMYSIPHFDALVAAAGFEKVQGLTLGFGPFSLLRHAVLPEDTAVRLDRKLQGLASRHVPILRSCGHVYLALARKPAPHQPTLVSVTGVRARDGSDRQELVNAYFQSHSRFWKEVYQDSDLYAVIHQDRQKLVLDWIDRVSAPPGSAALEVGCGAGGVAVALAQRGYFVEAIDPVQAMVEQTQIAADEAGVAQRICARVGDGQSLAIPDNLFDLVVAMGVLPWLPRPERGVQEMARVLKPGGYLILNIDNAWPLNHLLDPAIWMKLPLGTAARRLGLLRAPRVPLTTRSSIRKLDALIRSRGLEKCRSMTLGFGPFSLFGRTFLSEPAAVKVHHQLQQLCARRFPILSRTGAQYVVLARKVRRGRIALN